MRKPFATDCRAAKHIENIGHFTELPVVCLNRFASDSEEELEVVRQFCEANARFAISDHFGQEAMALDLALSS